MMFYLIITASTIITATAVAHLWRITNDRSVGLGFFALYYWSLHGSWTVVSDLSSGETAASYQYLFDRLFELQLDATYLKTLLYYGLFIAVVAATMVWTLRGLPRRPRVERAVVWVSHPTLLLMSSVAASVSYWIVSSTIGIAIAANQSAYLITRDDSLGVMFALHQILNKFALLPAAFGLAIAMSGTAPKYIGGSHNKRFVPFYSFLLVILYVYCAILGNKNELLMSMVAGGLFYLANAERPRLMTLAIAAPLGLSLVLLIDWVRGLPAGELAASISLNDAMEALNSAPSSIEAFAAHLSLYGVINKEVPIRLGSSLVSLVASLVPRAIWADRPLDIYPYYATSVGAISGQGYSIHHATGWYLNFGGFGVVAGAIVLGLVWSKVFSERHTSTARSSTSRILLAIGPSAMAAGMPNLIRSGIEGYKPLLIESFLIPTISLTLACFAARTFGSVNPRNEVVRRPVEFRVGTLGQAARRSNRVRST